MNQPPRGSATADTRERREDFALARMHYIETFSTPHLSRHATTCPGCAALVRIQRTIEQQQARIEELEAALRDIAENGGQDPYSAGEARIARAALHATGAWFEVAIDTDVKGNEFRNTRLNQNPPNPRSAG